MHPGFEAAVLTCEMAMVVGCLYRSLVHIWVSSTSSDNTSSLKIEHTDSAPVHAVCTMSCQYDVYAEYIVESRYSGFLLFIAETLGTVYCFAVLSLFISNIQF